jgi:hypothetical protein
VNALAIKDDLLPYPGQPSLPQYYSEHVIGGPRAFVLEADDYVAFGEALVAKIRHEII